MKHPARKLIPYSLWAALFALLPLAGALAQTKINQGVDMSNTTGLFTPNSFIYYGAYKHATAFNEQTEMNPPHEAITWEATPTPIAWRVMGNEGDDVITLMSEYVLDSKAYSASPTDAWGAGVLYNWLNGTTSSDFSGNFTGAEDASVKPVPSLNAPTYSWSGSIAYVASFNSVNTKFYIPWGTPNQGGVIANNNKVLWTTGSVTSPGSWTATDYVDDALRKGKLKGEVGDYGVFYWLRPHINGLSAQKLVVKSDGDINFEGYGREMGVRPMFKLDTTNILFAAELKEINSIELADQIVADNSGVYIDEDAIPGGGTGKKAYKLTLWDGSSSSITTPLTYDEDESLGGISDTITVKVWDVASPVPHPFSLAVTGIPGIYDGIAYKTVSNANRLEYYNYTAGINTLELIPDNMYTKYVTSASGMPVPNPDYRNLPSSMTNLYTVYAWAQKNNANRSNEGSAPFAFTMRALEDDVAPVLSVPTVVRNADHSARVKFNNSENYQRGKYYYVLDPAIPPTSFADFGLTNKTPFNLATSADSIYLAPMADAPHVMYIIAKDLVRNISNILEIPIHAYEAPLPPVANSPLSDIDLMVGSDTTILATALAYDDNTGDRVSVVSIVTPPGTANAVATVIGGNLHVSAVNKTAGQTSAVVRIEDLTGLWVDVTININVYERTPDILIDFVEEQLTGFTSGAPYSFNNSAPTATSGTALDSIPEAWFGTTVYIVRENVNPALRSKPQALVIPARPEPPVVKALPETYSNFRDGEMHNVNDSMLYRPSDADEWIVIPPQMPALTYLPPGKYQVCYKAFQHVSFASFPAEVVIASGTAQPAIPRSVILPDVTGVTVTPTSGIHYLASSSTFNFSLQFTGPPLVVKTNRIIDGATEYLTGVPNETGGFDYSITRIVTQQTTVSIGPDIVASETVATSSIWSGKGLVYVRTRQEGLLSLYSLSGAQVKCVEVAQGETSVPVAQGVYVAVLKDGTRQKVIVL